MLSESKVVKKKTKFNTDISSLLKDTKVITYKSSGPGGQRKNKKETSVKLHHIPSGLNVIATEQRSQAGNKQLAFRRLQNRLSRINRSKRIRIPTSMSLAVKENILKKKKIHSEKKQLRKKINIPDEF